MYVLLCCWLAAVGAGLLKSEEILVGVARLRLSNDIEFEEQNFIAMMSDAREVSSSHLIPCGITLDLIQMICSMSKAKHLILLLIVKERKF